MPVRCNGVSIPDPDGTVIPSEFSSVYVVCVLSSCFKAFRKQSAAAWVRQRQTIVNCEKCDNIPYLIKHSWHIKTPNLCLHVARPNKAVNKRAACQEVLREVFGMSQLFAGCVSSAPFLEPTCRHQPSSAGRCCCSDVGRSQHLRVHATMVCAPVICRCAFCRCQPPVPSSHWHRKR